METTGAMIGSSGVTTLDEGVYLGPARVGNVALGRIQLEIGTRRVWALSALGFPCEPVPGDTILAISQNDNWYVIGVLESTAKRSFVVPGDLELHAPHGSIELKSAKGLYIRSPMVGIVSGRLELLARNISEKFETATRWVRESLDLRVGNLRTMVRSDYRVKARRIVERATEDVRIDGKKIDLG